MFVFARIWTNLPEIDLCLSLILNLIVIEIID